MLPRISPDGRLPMQVYAKGFDPSNRRPRVGVLVAGFGLNEADSEEAIRSLPPAVTLAFSPYAARPLRLLDVARLADHEFLASIPMEPQGYPRNDAGTQALLVGAPAEQNRARLFWALSRISGFAGVTGALVGPLRGDRFAASVEPMTATLELIGDRGLFFIDARPGAAALPLAWNRSIDVILDDPPVRSDLEEKLGKLEALARERGSALGLFTAVRPVLLARVTAWANGLSERGVALAPVSALVRPPGPAAAP